MIVEGKAWMACDDPLKETEIGVTCTTVGPDQDKSGDRCWNVE